MESYIDIVNIITYFIIYSFFLWVMESVIKTANQRKPVNSGFLYGPFCPIYGFGATIMFLFLNNFKNNIMVLFFIGFFVLSLWEYIVGWLLEKIFKTKYWDYSEKKFNIRGRVCLSNSLFWGILGVLFTKYIHPNIVQHVEYLVINDLLFFVSLLSIIIIVDFVTSTIKVSNISFKLEKLTELTNIIKEKIEELETKQIGKESLQEVIEELNYKQAKLRRKLLKQTSRLKKAFPTMKSEAVEKINEFLNQKIENIKKGK